MIKELEKNKLKKYFRKGYAKRVIKVLEQNTGRTTSENYVRRVLNNGLNSPDIETAILEVADQYIEEATAYQNEKNKIIGKTQTLSS